MTDSQPTFADAQSGIERAKRILQELADAAQSAAYSLADEQRDRAAKQVGTLAEALRAAAGSFEHSRNPAAAEFAHSAADQVEEFRSVIHARDWVEIATDLEDIARHRPFGFIAGAVALGFLFGRLATAGLQAKIVGDRDSSRAPEGRVSRAAGAMGGRALADGAVSSQP